MQKRTIILVSCLFLLLTNATYIFAISSLDGNSVFGGLIQNPIDGFSYLAKMYQGWAGSWRFVLPYTSEPGNGAYLFLFYLFLGHVARIFSVPLIIIFHTARIISSFLLVIILYFFITKTIKPPNGLIIPAYIVTLFSSGLGWVLFPLGFLTPDFWVAEAYPFLSSYGNPHFPLGLALLLLLFIISLNTHNLKLGLFAFFIGLVLSVVMQFGVVVAAVVLIGWTTWTSVKEGFIPWKKVLFPLLGGGLFLIYQFVVIKTDPILNGWNEQNQTVAPPFWELAIAFFPVLLLGLIGINEAKRSLNIDIFRFLVSWCLIGTLLIYFPFNLQRRFMFGLFIPYAILSTFGLQLISRKFKIKFTFLLVIMLVVSLPTNLLVLSSGVFSVYTRDPRMYLSRTEFAALEWIQINSPERCIVMASPEMGLFIPAYTGRRVLFGHSFETVNAEEEKLTLESFYSNTMTFYEVDQLITKRKIDYIFEGTREKKLGNPDYLMHLPILFNQDGITIYGTTAGQK